MEFIDDLYQPLSDQQEIPNSESHCLFYWTTGFLDPGRNKTLTTEVLTEILECK